MATLIGEEIAVRLDGMITPDAEGRMTAPERDQTAIQGQDGGRVLFQRFDIARRIVRGERQPGLAGGEARVPRAVPLHRRALRVAYQPEARLVLLPRVRPRSGGISIFPRPISSPQYIVGV